MKTNLIGNLWKILVLVCFYAAPLIADEQFGLFSYRVVDGTVTIVDYPEDAVGEVGILAEIDRKSVTLIGARAFGDCSWLTSITIPERVTNISQGAFADCGLTCATIPSTVTEIGAEAFSDCSGLTRVTIP